MTTEGQLNILIVGVGGQGILMASKILGEAALRSGTHVVIAEVHGMAQRGGVVRCAVRLGKVHSPLIPKGRVDVLLGFEPIETVRHIERTSKETFIVTNTSPVVPFSAHSGPVQYPVIKDLFLRLKEVRPRVVFLPAEKLAEEAGIKMAANAVMLGALAGSGLLPFSADILEQAIRDIVPTRYIEQNAKGFRLGVETSSRKKREYVDPVLAAMAAQPEEGST